MDKDEQRDKATTSAKQNMIQFEPEFLSAHASIAAPTEQESPKGVDPDEQVDTLRKERNVQDEEEPMKVYEGMDSEEKEEINPEKRPISKMQIMNDAEERA